MNIKRDHIVKLYHNNGGELEFHYNPQEYSGFVSDLNDPKKLFFQMGYEVDDKVNIIISRKQMENTNITIKIENDEVSENE